MKRWLPILLFIFLPKLAAAVSINEVAWMGDATSANHEWIELYNPGETISVAGWTLSDGMNLNITLAGEIAAGSYAVLERTSEESASGPAFVVYTGALVNGGATLTLKTATGEIQDQIAGGENWQSIGGDNVTKETAQYRPSGWVTDTATPGSVNGEGRVETPDPDPETAATTTTTNTNTSTNTTTSSSNSGGSKRSATTPLVREPSDLKLKVERQEVAYVGQPIRFLVTGSGLSPSEGRLLRYHWNFGDTHATSGTEVWHTYDYPGTYVVTVATRKGLNEQVVRTEVTVVPVAMSLSFGQSGVVHLHNNSPYDIDVSGYTVSASRSVVFPPRSIVRASGTVTLGASELGSWASGVRVLDSAGGLVVARRPGEAVVSQRPPAVTTLSTPARVSTLSTFLSAPVTAATPGLSIPMLIPSPTPLQLAATTTELLAPTTTVITILPESPASSDNLNTDRRGYGVLLAILLLCLLGLYVRRPKVI